MTAYQWWDVLLKTFGFAISIVGLYFLIKQLRHLGTQVDTSSAQLKLVEQQAANSTRQLALFDEQMKMSRDAVDRATNEAIVENTRQRERATVNFIAATLERQHNLHRLVTADGFLESAGVRGSAEYFDLRSYLGYLENLAAGVRMGVLDLLVVDRGIGSRLVHAWKQYGAWINDERILRNNDRLFEEIELLVPDLPQTEHEESRVVESRDRSHNAVPPAI